MSPNRVTALQGDMNGVQLVKLQRKTKICGGKLSLWGNIKMEIDALPPPQFSSCIGVV